LAQDIKNDASWSCGGLQVGFRYDGEPFMEFRVCSNYPVPTKRTR